MGKKYEVNFAILESNTSRKFCHIRKTTLDVNSVIFSKQWCVEWKPRASDMFVLKKQHVLRVRMCCMSIKCFWDSQKNKKQHTHVSSKSDVSHKKPTTPKNTKNNYLLQMTNYRSTLRKVLVILVIYYSSFL